MRIFLSIVCILNCVGMNMVSLNNFEETEKLELIVKHGFNEEKSNGDHEVFNFSAQPHPAVSVLACARHFFPLCAAWNVFQKSSDPRFFVVVTNSQKN